jgi:hypothetical protein
MGAVSHRPHARSLRPLGAVSPHTPQKPSGQIPCQHSSEQLPFLELHLIIRKYHIIHIRTRHVSFSILIGRNSVAEWLIVASTYHLNSDPK